MFGQLLFDLFEQQCIYVTMYKIKVFISRFKITSLIGRVAALERQQRYDTKKHLCRLQHELYATENFFQPKDPLLPQ